MPGDGLALFLQTIHPTDVGYCELRALPSKTQVFVPVGDVDAVAAFLDTHQHENVYCGVATRRTPTTGSLDNCGELWTLFVDLDFKTLSEADARARLAAFLLPPTLIIHSGGGLHVYWQLRDALILPADEATARSWLRRVARHFGADLASAEPARVLRVPGGWNHKSVYGNARRVGLEEGASSWMM